MRTRALLPCGLAGLALAALAACEAVPDLTFPDGSAASDSGDDASDAAAQDGATADGGCSVTDVSCKNDHECCSQKCQGSGNHKTCAP